MSASKLPRIYCDFNTQIVEDGFALDRQGTLADAVSLGITLAQGLEFSGYDLDAGADGKPMLLVADMVVAEEPGIGLLAKRVSPFRHEQPSPVSAEAEPE